tara:strand:- start:541 stop:1128 length:588 start_codon:yes stop_codon:yes gene_type:complete
MSKKIQGWNPTYFGEPKKGSLASVIADITNKQNEQQGGKPEVMDSAVVQAEKAKEQLAKEGKMMKATHKPGQKDDENTAKDMRKKNQDDAKGEDKPVKVHGEDLNKKIEDAKMQKVKSLVDTIKDMFYTPEATQKELTDKQKKLPPALQKAIKAKEKEEDKEVDEKLVGGQKKLDKDKDGDIDGKDFAMLRKSKK